MYICFIIFIYFSSHLVKSYLISCWPPYVYANCRLQETILFVLFITKSSHYFCYPTISFQLYFFSTVIFCFCFDFFSFLLLQVPGLCLLSHPQMSVIKLHVPSYEDKWQKQKKSKSIQHVTSSLKNINYIQSRTVNKDLSIWNLPTNSYIIIRHYRS